MPHANKLAFINTADTGASALISSVPVSSSMREVWTRAVGMDSNGFVHAAGGGRASLLAFLGRVHSPPADSIGSVTSSDPDATPDYSVGNIRTVGNR
jgi:hypothetical protein